ncbi:helix-turn-helix domain-containing protein [Promicromonospora sp. Marseille-Q5078]
MRIAQVLTDDFAMAKLSVMSLVAVREAAERLGVSARQVQNLVAQGELTAPARGVIESESIDRFLAVRGSTRTRPWSQPTAWGAVAILAGVDATWLGATQRSRLRSALRSVTAAELIARARERARVKQFAGHSSVTERVRDALVDTAAVGPGLGLAGSTRVDGYADADGLAMLVRRYGLVPDDAGQLTVRVTTFPMDTVRELAASGVVLAGLDLAESLDTRERRAGLDAIGAALGRLHG